MAEPAALLSRPNPFPWRGAFVRCSEILDDWPLWAPQDVNGMTINEERKRRL